MQGANSNSNSSTLTVPKPQQQQQQRGSTSAQGGLTGAGYKGLGLTRQALAALGYRRSSVAVPSHQEESPMLQVSSSDTSTKSALLLYIYNGGIVVPAVDVLVIVMSVVVAIVFSSLQHWATAVTLSDVQQRQIAYWTGSCHVLCTLLTAAC
jgi:hypothetical protein